MERRKGDKEKNDGNTVELIGKEGEWERERSKEEERES